MRCLISCSKSLAGLSPARTSPLYAVPPLTSLGSPLYRCVSDPPVICDAFHSGMRVFRVAASEIRHEWVELANVPREIEDVFSDDLRRRRKRSVRPALDQIMDLPTNECDTPKPRRSSYWSPNQTAAAAQGAAAFAAAARGAAAGTRSADAPGEARTSE